MTEKKHANRIPEEDVADFRRWNIPLIDSKGQVLPSAEREAAVRRKAEQKQKGERVEDVLYKGGGAGGMSAGEFEKIFEQAEKEGFEQGRQAGYEKGLAEGYEAGQEQGVIEKRQELVAEQQRFQHLIQSLLEPLAEQEEDLEQMLLDTVCRLTESLVERELLTDSSHILALVKEAVAALPVGAKNLRLYLNPDDLALVESYAEEQQLSWQFFGDETLLPGGARVETSESRVDFSVGNRLQALLKAFVNRQLTDEGSAETNVEDQDSGASGSETP